MNQSAGQNQRRGLGIDARYIPAMVFEKLKVKVVDILGNVTMTLLRSPWEGENINDDICFKTLEFDSLK